MLAPNPTGKKFASRASQIFQLLSKSNVFAKMELENAKKSGMSVKIASKVAIMSKIQLLSVPAEAVPKNVDRVHLTRKVAKKLRNFKTSAISNSAFLVYQQRPGYTVPHPCVLTPPLRPKASVVRLAEAVRERGNFSTKAKANLMS